MIENISDYFENYKPVKKKTYIKVGEYPIKFRVLPNKVEDVGRWVFIVGENKYFERKELLVRDMSDGRFKKLQIPKYAFKQLVEIIMSNGIDIKKNNPYKKTFKIQKVPANHMDKYWLKYEIREV